MAAHADTYGRRRLRAASSLLDAHIRWVLVAPAVLLILFMTIYPLGYSMWVNFVNYDFAIPGHRWVALDNFKTVWDDPIARHALWVTLGLSAAAVAVELVLGFLLALAMLRAFVGRRMLMVLFVVPLFVSPVIVGTFFSLILTCRTNGFSPRLLLSAPPSPLAKTSSRVARTKPLPGPACSSIAGSFR